MVEDKKLWDRVLVEMELGMSKANFTTWLKDTCIIKQEDGVVYLSVPNAFVKDWLTNKFHKPILKALRDFGENIRSVEYIVTKELKKKDEGLKKLAAFNNELPLSEHYINKEDNLNQRYTFDSFVIGPFNEIAYAAAQAVIKKPGTAYNPLFIYGNTGHGKTHLIQSIGNYIKNHYPSKKVHYVTSEKYVVDYVGSMQTNKINQFKDKYKKYDVLIMDDIQFLSNKVHYVTSEKYVVDYVGSMQTNKINQFKDKYKKYDVLIMDDIQFLSNKEKS